MPDLSQLTSSDEGPSARVKINAAIAEASKVSGKADATALAALGGSVDTVIRLFGDKADKTTLDAAVRTLGDKADKTALAAEVTRASAAETANTKAITDEVTARTAADTALSNRLDGFTTLISPNADLIGGASDRPGDSRSLFTRVMTGEPKGRAIIDRGTIVTNDDMGQALRIAATDVDANPGFIDIAPRRSVFFRPFRTYIARFAFARVANPTDPSQNAVEARIQNLSSSFAQVSTARLGLFTPVVADGVVYADILIGKAGAPGNLVYTIPDTSRYGVPYLRIYGNGQTTDVGAIAVYDVTDGLLGGADVAAITARISTFEARLKAIEGATGIDASLISGLAADRDAVRATRYFGRPGDALRTWTADVGATPQAATPLAVGGAYSIVSTVMGPALRITGVASARPIAQIPLDDLQVEEFKVTIKRGVDSSTSSDNAPVFSFACFKADGTPNGTVGLPADPLTVAQGIKSYTFRASLVAGLGTVDLPAGTRRVNLIPGGKGTGAIDVIGVERGAQSSTTATSLPLNTRFGLQLVDLLTGERVGLNNAQSIAWIQEIVVPTVYTKEITDAVVTDTSSIIIAGDLDRVGDISIQVPLNFEVGLNFTDSPAVFDQPGTWLQRSGEWVNHPNPGKSAVSAICRRVGGTGTVSCKLNVRITRKVDGALPSKLADAVFSKWVDPVDPRYKAVIRAEIDFLQSYGIYEKIKGWWMPGGSKNNFRVNLANPATPLLVYTEGEGGITFTPYKSIKGDGISSSIDTTLTPTDLSWDAAGHFLAAKATGPGNTSTIMAGASNPALRAGSVNGVYGFISGASPESNTDSPKADLKWYAVCRRDAQNIIAFIDGQEVFNRARTFTLGSPRTLRILSSVNAATTGHTAVPCGGVAAGPPLTAQSIQRFNESCLRIEAVCTQIVGA